MVDGVSDGSRDDLCDCVIDGSEVGRFQRSFDDFEDSSLDGLPNYMQDKCEDASNDDVFDGSHDE